ncbi:hypothetical protein NQ317_002487 [Molorchus minor]|uniref:Uncharacterized protein n=1 Tax=Molorchus minor TaxID=1323400 RepID=A0ABQ9J9Y0_9CUCU|nr:hypothetical protein NQ317_002487 [Molorchus minor]
MEPGSSFLTHLVMVQKSVLLENPTQKMHDAICVFCDETFFKDIRSELWVKCIMCEIWAHCDCADCEKDDYEKVGQNVRNAAERALPTVVGYAGVAKQVVKRSINIAPLQIGPADIYSTAYFRPRLPYNWPINFLDKPHVTRTVLISDKGSASIRVFAITINRRLQSEAVTAKLNLNFDS